MPLKACIFDLDGVIVNTVPLHFKAWKKMFSEYGKKFDFKDYKEKVDGIPRIEGARAILPEVSPEELERAAAKKQEYFLQLLKREGVKIYNSTVKLIRALKKKKVKLAVVSSSKNCPFILEKTRLVNLFETVISGKDITKGKPNPEIFLLAAKKLGVKPGGCVVFEDAVLGVEAAKRARMKCVGIDRYGKPRRLRKADLVVSDLREISIRKLEGLMEKR